MQRGTNRLTRDNAGRITSVGGDGATARGGRLRTASGKQRATVTAKGIGKAPAGTVSKAGKVKGAARASSARQGAARVSSARQAATDRLKVKTQTRRAMRADRASVVTPGQRSRLEAGKGATMKGARPASTVAKPRTAGNTKEQVASRVQRKLAAERAKMSVINRAERVGATQGNQRERSYKRQATLERAQTFLATGKLPGKDNSIAAQRSMKQARERLAAKNAARRQARAAANVSRTAAAKPLPGNRRLTKPQVRSQLRTESALKIYKGGEAANREIRNAKGLARTKKAQNNWMQTREKRMADARMASLPMATVGKATKNAARRRGDTAATAKPARRRAAVGKISEAKANRIVARIDANRPGLRAASESARRTQNAIRTHSKASDFTLAAAARARRSGKPITVAQSLQRAVSNAAKRRRR